MRTRRLAVLVVAVIALQPAIARADPARPTNYRSVVDHTEPSGAYTARVVGGDAFLEIEATAGHEIIVLGYEGEPYLWFQPDGDVMQNTRSPASYLNEDRYGRVAGPPTGIDPGAEPNWERVAGGGRWTWHDHRTHWMAPTVPSVVAESGGTGPVTIFTWEVPVMVDGVAGRIMGTLHWLPGLNPLPWVLAALGLTVLAAWYARRRPAQLLVMAASLALVLGFVRLWYQPSAVRQPDLDVVAPLAALLLSAYVVVITPRGRTPRSPWYLAPALAALALWVFGRVPVVDAPVLPTLLAEPVERLATVTVWGATLAAAAGALFNLGHRVVPGSR